MAVSVDRKVYQENAQEAGKSVRAAGTLYPAGSGFDPGGGYCLVSRSRAGSF